MQKSVFEENLVNAVAAVVKTQRARKKMSQREMSISTNLNRSYLSDLELGKVNPSIVNLGRIAIALDTSVSALLLEAEAILLNSSKELELPTLMPALPVAQAEDVDVPAVSA